MCAPLCLWRRHPMKGCERESTHREVVWNGVVEVNRTVEIITSNYKDYLKTKCLITSCLFVLLL